MLPCFQRLIACFDIHQPKMCSRYHNGSKLLFYVCTLAQSGLRTRKLDLFAALEIEFF